VCNDEADAQGQQIKSIHTSYDLPLYCGTATHAAVCGLHIISHMSISTRATPTPAPSNVVVVTGHTEMFVLKTSIALIYTYLLLRILRALLSLMRYLQAASASGAAAGSAVAANGAAPDAATRCVGCVSGLSATRLSAGASAKHAWAPVDWSGIKLRIGPNYKKNKRKAPTATPLLPCVGVDLLCAERKIFCDGLSDAACLPPEVAAAAKEPTPSASSATQAGGGSLPPLPRFLVVTISMPRYSAGAADGPNLRFAIYFSVPAGLRKDPSPAASLLCEFLDGSSGGHNDPKGKGMLLPLRLPASPIRLLALPVLLAHAPYPP
jgi:hypothetical protein